MVARKTHGLADALEAQRRFPTVQPASAEAPARVFGLPDGKAAGGLQRAAPGRAFAIRQHYLGLAAGNIDPHQVAPSGPSSGLLDSKDRTVVLIRQAGAGRHQGRHGQESVAPWQQRAVRLRALATVARLLSYLCRGFLLLAFSFFGLGKLILTPRDLALHHAWTADLPIMVSRVVGLSEVACATALLVSMASRRFARLLVPAAAVLFANQCVAVAVHLLRRETNVSLPLNILWFALIVYLLWYGTHRPATIQRADEPMEMPLCER
jgi:hypothetical protein